jgi:predicted amidohydrolase YtcJ
LVVIHLSDMHEGVMKEIPHRPVSIALRLLASTLALVITGAFAQSDRVAGAPADLVLRNGAVYTVDAGRSWAEAIAVRDGRIVYVGRNAGLGVLIGPKTRVVDLHGRMVLPGMHDAHIHPISSGMQALGCDLTGKLTADEYVAAVKACAAERPDAAWIVGGGWLMSVFGAGAMPSRSLLDAIVPDRPVLLTSSDGHTGWANSKALAIAGITRDTPDPPDGRIDRDPQTGEPVGSLQEGAIALVDRHVPPPTPAQRMDGLRYTVKMLNAYGITGFQDASVSPAELEAYAALDAAQELTAHAVLAQWWEREKGVEQIVGMEQRRKQFTRGHVRATSVKIMQDGVMENYTAVMLEPYLVAGSPRGIPMLQPAALNAAVTALDAKGFQVHFHAIGDAAIRQCLDAVQAARERNGASGLRHHISHLELIDPADAPRFRALEVIANFQPLWAYPDPYITELTIPFIGEKRAAHLYPIGSVHASGGMIAFGSDWSVSSANPFEQIEVAVRRADPVTPDGAALLPEQRLSLPTAIAAFTINAAYVNGMETDVGSIEVGKRADLAVLDQNLFAIDPRAISDTQVLLTLFEGKPVHGDPGKL